MRSHNPAVWIRRLAAARRRPPPGPAPDTTPAGPPASGKGKRRDRAQGRHRYNPDRACQHLNFVADVAVNRIEPDANGHPKAFHAVLTVQCAPAPDGCGEKFRFTGVPAGLAFAHPSVDVTEMTLTAPIRPASADPDFGIGIPGFAIQQVQP